MARTRTNAEFLDREKLVRVAADVADRDGWSQLTLSQVAKEVDRHVTSMYGHVESLEALRREVALLAMHDLSDEVWRAALGRVRDDALEAIAIVYRRFGLEHPGRAAAMANVPLDMEMRAVGAHLAEPIRATFRSYGLDEHQAAIAHRVFSATVFGFVRAEATNHFPQAETDEAFRQAVRLFAAGLSTGEWPSA